MKQLLILGFHCKVYTKKPLVRVFVEDNFIDEFELPENHYDENAHKSMPDIIVLRGEEKLKAFDMPNAGIDTVADNDDIKIRAFHETSKIEISKPYLKFITFDDIDTRNLSIRIEVANSDSNYTNGFMTDSTLIMLNQVWIVSEKLINRINTIENNYRYTAKNYTTKHSLPLFKKLMLNGERIAMFKSLLDIDNLKVFNDPQNKTVEINSKTNNVDMGISEQWFGGNMSIKINLVKKHGQFIEPYHDPKGPWRLGDIESMKYLLNKYKHHEDQ